MGKVELSYAVLKARREHVENLFSKQFHCAHCRTEDPSRFAPNNGFYCLSCREKMLLVDAGVPINDAFGPERKVPRAARAAKSLTKAATNSIVKVIVDPVVKQIRKMMNVLYSASQARISNPKHPWNKTEVYNISVDFLVYLCGDQGALCPILRVRLRFKSKSNFKASLDRINDSITYTTTNCRIICSETNTPSKWTDTDPAKLIEWYQQPAFSNDALDFLFSQTEMVIALDKLITTTTQSLTRKSENRPFVGKYEICYEFFALMFYFQGGRCWYTGAPLGITSPSERTSVLAHPCAASPERLDVLQNYTLANTVLIERRCQSANQRANYDDPNSEEYGDANWNKLKFHYVMHCQECYNSNPRIVPEYYEDWLLANPEIQKMVEQEESRRIIFVEFARILLEKMKANLVDLNQGIEMVKFIKLLPKDQDYNYLLDYIF
ncbi:hypothetical protein DFA_03528 [Cavenderia fasciculata]|uniref:Uncharacterized protein n=1 Tax=Cavenderia fasciculata TaxID=261658 RepID=F4PHU6_CACFS|nr:uncharacterized protein DFA_03528 [Cavenderia fasciculata]EGG25280.1 hypothetical protein DFA_03528 [Cavenderia fasciculata]|eukprot:XP_004363131.1 hypothetical protein DFA_03528 [Cavenderia fasciculata]